MATILLNVKVNENDIKQAEKEVSKIINKKTSNSGKSGDTKSATANVDNLRKSYANLLTTIKGSEKYFKKGTFSAVTEEAEKYQRGLKNLDKALKDGRVTQEQYNKGLKGIEKRLGIIQREFAETKQQSKNLHGSLLEIVKGFGKFQLAAMLVMKPLQLIREAWADINETLVETENRVIELRRVAGSVANSDELYELAQRYGQTFENVSEITLNFARNGMQWTEALKATEAALLAINVAELDSTQASEGMIAIMQQFGYEAGQLETIVDKLNITADNAAVTTEKLLLALQRTGSSAKNAKLSLEDTVGIITALSEATGRSGENLGTAVNSLIQFSTKSSALDTFAKLGGNVAKAVENYRMGAGTVLEIWRELSAVVKSSGNETEGILGGLFGDDDWRNLNEELQNDLGENFATVTEIYSTASTFRKNYFIALLQNLDQVDETLATMNKAQGYSQRENEQYLDTYTARLNELQSKWKEIANDEQGLLGAKKVVVEIGIGLLNIFDVLGGIQGLALGIVGGLAGGIFGASGIGALVGVGASALINYFTERSKKQERERDLSIDTWKANEKNANELAKVLNSYKSLDKTSSNYLNIEKQLTSLLGDKAVALQGLKEGTDEYRKALLKLSEVELDRYEQQQSKAFNAVGERLQGAGIANTPFAKRTTFKAENLKYSNLLNALGVDYSVTNEGGYKAFGLNGISYEKTAEAAVANYNLYVETADKVWSKYKQYLLEGNDEMATQAYGVWEDLDSVIQKYGDDVKDYLHIKETLDWVNQIREESSKVEDNVDGIKQKLEDMSKDTLNEIIEQFKELQDEENYLLDLENARERISKSQRDLEEEKAKLIEKENNLLKAQQALQDVKNQRTVRVYNSATGRWEQVSNQKDIATAQENVDKARNDIEQQKVSILEAQKNIEEARSAYEKQAYESVIELLGYENLTSEEMINLLSIISSVMPDIADKIRDILIKMGVDLSAPKPVYSGGGGSVRNPPKVSLYDSGGVLYGMGGIKATNEPEIVLPPNIASKILEPSSNEQFKNFTKSLGILFGASDMSYRNGNGSIVHNFGGSTTNNNNSNNSYNVNGVPIGKDIAENYTIAQAFELINQLN